jgi:hypothetical protein
MDRRSEETRSSRGVKLTAEALPTKGSARFDMPAAIKEIKEKWESMVERWEQ